MYKNPDVAEFILKHILCLHMLQE